MTVQLCSGFLSCKVQGCRQHRLTRSHVYAFAFLGSGATLSAVSETSWSRLGPTVTTASGWVSNRMRQETGQLVFLLLLDEYFLTCSHHLDDNGGSHLVSHPLLIGLITRVPQGDGDCCTSCGEDWCGKVTISQGNTQTCQQAQIHGVDGSGRSQEMRRSTHAAR